VGGNGLAYALKQLTPEVNRKGLWFFQRHKNAREFPVTRDEDKVFALDELRRSIPEFPYSGYLHGILPSITL